MFFVRKKNRALRVALARAEKEAQLQAELAAAALGQLEVLREACESRVADLKGAYERENKANLRTIDVLAEQVEYLRLIMGRPQPVQPRESMFAPVQPPAPIEFEQGLPYVTEEEEDLRAMHDAGLLDIGELNNALGQLTGAGGFD